jgi:uncharacterized protein YjbJ (UPF0337 family)
MTTPTQQTASGQWMKLKGKLREAWGALTDSDLDRYEGQLDQLVGHIQKTTGQERAKIHSDVERFAKEMQYRF